MFAFSNAYKPKQIALFVWNFCQTVWSNLKNSELEKSNYCYFQCLQNQKKSHFSYEIFVKHRMKQPQKVFSSFEKTWEIKWLLLPMLAKPNEFLCPKNVFVSDEATIKHLLFIWKNLRNLKWLLLPKLVIPKILCQAFQKDKARRGPAITFEST